MYPDQPSIAQYLDLLEENDRLRARGLWSKTTFYVCSAAVAVIAFGLGMWVGLAIHH